RAELPSSLPLVTVGTAQARCLAADLFAMEGRTVILPDPCREGDHDLFAMRLGARILTCAFDPSAISALLTDFPNGEPVVVLLELPREETGYIPVQRERLSLCSSLVAMAEHRPLLVIVDDTWESLGTPSDSLFWSLTGRHPNLIPLKVDGAEGQLGFREGQVGFLTLPWDPDSGVAAALESKMKMLLRAQVGSPSAASQVLLLRRLRERLP
ncbi:MAG TPA: hypothetical protein VIW92_08395, partial [Thermoanaerobaculia bacterium]